MCFGIGFREYQNQHGLRQWFVFANLVSGPIRPSLRADIWQLGDEVCRQASSWGQRISWSHLVPTDTKVSIDTLVQQRAARKMIGISCQRRLNSPFELALSCPAWRSRGSDSWSGGRNRTRGTHAASLWVAPGFGMSRLLSARVKPSVALGIENENVAPGPSFGAAHKRPS